MLLALQVFEARNLPDTDRFILSKLVNSKDVTDPYVSGYLDTTKVGRKKHKTQMLRRVRKPLFHDEIGISLVFCGGGEGQNSCHDDLGHIFSDEAPSSDGISLLQKR